MAELDQINVDGVHYDFRDAKAYQKPQDGIPASDLTSAIQALLTKASTALQPQDLNTLNSDVASLKALIESDSNNVIDKFNEIVAFLNGISSSSSLSGIVSDIASQINAKYTKPASGIPSTDLAQGVQTSLNKANSAYQKPSAGIPKTDLAQAVQTTLSNADTDHTNVATLQEKVSAIEGKIPSAASASNQLVDNESLSEHYAKKDGAYEEMLAGSALNLVDTSGSPVLREFTFDTAGGTNDIATGSALIKKMRGNTIVWNQLGRNSNTVENKQRLNNTDMVNGDGYITITKKNADTQILGVRNDDADYLNNQNYNGHVFLFSVCVKPNAGGNVIFGSVNYNVTQRGGYSISKQIPSSNYTKLSVIFPAFVYNQNYNLCSVGSIDANITSIDIKYWLIFDLTQMFGAGNEPSTVEEFEKLFPMPYYDYNEGQLLSYNGNSIKTVGFNQWDEEWEVGTIAQGNPASATNAYRSKNFSPCLPKTNYYAKVPHRTFIFWYDANKQYLGVYNQPTEAVSTQLITSPEGAYYFKINDRESATYNHDICINLSWSGTRNGTYEPYQEHVHDISFYKTIKDGDGNLLFPNGLLSAGSVYDEVTATKAIKRVGVVDLGTLNWQVVTASRGEIRSTTNWSADAPALLFGTYNHFFTQNNAKGYKVAFNNNDLSMYDITQKLVINDARLANKTAEEVKAAMSGVMLYYELAEPIEVDFEEQNMAYQVNDYGTEQLLPENTSTPTTTPAMLDVTYGINAVDTIKNLPRNYLAQDDLDRLLSAMGSALGFTYTKTWNENDKQWAFTVTKTATTTDENV